MLRIATTFLLCIAFAAPVRAEDILSDRQRVEHLIRINSNGLLSISYKVKSNKMAEYAYSLYKVLYEDFTELNVQCSDVMQSMMDNPKLRLKPEFNSAVKNLFNKGEIHHVLMMNAVLKQYAGKHPIDSETAEYKGKFKPVLAVDCTNNDVENFGMIQRMFPTMDGALDSEIKLGTCSRIKKASSCLRDVYTISKSRSDTANQEIGLRSPKLLMNAWLVP